MHSNRLRTTLATVMTVVVVIAASSAADTFYVWTNSAANGPGTAWSNASHIHASSPCVAAGLSAYASGIDIDGDAWASPPSIGCDEPLGPFSGALLVSALADSTHVITGHSASFTADIQGDVSSNRWTFGDGTVLHNRSYGVEHAWATAGDYPVVLTAWNDDNSAGVSTTVMVHAVDGNYYVDAANPSPTPPYTSWSMAATNIQDAVDEAFTPGSTVWVTNGVYNTGGRATPGGSLMNRIVATNRISIRSVNGPTVTSIVGEGPLGPNAVRCAYLDSESELQGFTLSNGFTAVSGNYEKDRSGGGVFAPNGSVSNCVIAHNTAHWIGGGVYKGVCRHTTICDNSATYGGGAAYANLHCCLVAGNSATDRGGGVASDTRLYSCTVVDNTATTAGGGAYDAYIVYNSIIYYNTAPSAPNWTETSPQNMAGVCTTPDPGGYSSGCITNEPCLLNVTNRDYHLRYASPCIDAANEYFHSPVDLDGYIRPQDGNWDGLSNYDMGCFEYNPLAADSNSDGIPDWWYHRYALDANNPDISMGDPDHDSIRTGAEWVADTIPTNSESFLGITAVQLANAEATVNWHGGVSATQFVERCYNLTSTGELWSTVFTNLPPTVISPNWVDTDAGHTPVFYRIKATR